MEEGVAIAKLRYARILPKKAKLVADLVRGKPVSEAMSILEYTPKKAARIILKVMKSAIANAINNHNVADPDALYVRITVDRGPMLKRWRARAYGRAAMIRKRTSHITVVLDYS